MDSQPTNSLLLGEIQTIAAEESFHFSDYIDIEAFIQNDGLLQESGSTELQVLRDRVEGRANIEASSDTIEPEQDLSAQPETNSDAEPAPQDDVVNDSNIDDLFNPAGLDSDPDAFLDLIQNAEPAPQDNMENNFSINDLLDPSGPEFNSPLNLELKADSGVTPPDDKENIKLDSDEEVVDSQQKQGLGSASQHEPPRGRLPSSSHSRDHGLENEVPDIDTNAGFEIAASRRGSQLRLSMPPHSKGHGVGDKTTIKQESPRSNRGIKRKNSNPESDGTEEGEDRPESKRARIPQHPSKNHRNGAHSTNGQTNYAGQQLHAVPRNITNHNSTRSHSHMAKPSGGQGISQGQVLKTNKKPMSHNHHNERNNFQNSPGTTDRNIPAAETTRGQINLSKPEGNLNVSQGPMYVTQHISYVQNDPSLENAHYPPPATYLPNAEGVNTQPRGETDDVKDGESLTGTPNPPKHAMGAAGRQQNQDIQDGEQYRNEMHHQPPMNPQRFMEPQQAPPGEMNSQNLGHHQRQALRDDENQRRTMHQHQHQQAVDTQQQFMQPRQAPFTELNSEHAGRQAVRDDEHHRRMMQQHSMGIQQFMQPQQAPFAEMNSQHFGHQQRETLQDDEHHRRIIHQQQQVIGSHQSMQAPFPQMHNQAGPPHPGWQAAHHQFQPPPSEFHRHPQAMGMQHPIQHHSAPFQEMHNQFGPAYPDWQERHHQSLQVGPPYAVQPPPQHHMVRQEFDPRSQQIGPLHPVQGPPRVDPRSQEAGPPYPLQGPPQTPMMQQAINPRSQEAGLNYPVQQPQQPSQNTMKWQR